MIHNTCLEKECKFWKKYKKGCPNFVETVWTPSNGGQPQTILDCAPKRSLLLLTELSNRLIGVQQAAEQERNAMHKMTTIMAKAIETVQRKPILISHTDVQEAQIADKGYRDEDSSNTIQRSGTEDC